MSKQFARNARYKFINCRKFYKASQRNTSRLYFSSLCCSFYTFSYTLCGCWNLKMSGKNYFLAQKMQKLEKWKKKRKKHKNWEKKLGEKEKTKSIAAGKFCCTQQALEKKKYHGGKLCFLVTAFMVYFISAMANKQINGTEYTIRQIQANCAFFIEKCNRNIANRYYCHIEAWVVCLVRWLL